MTTDLPPNMARADRVVVRDLAAWGIPTPPVTVRMDLDGRRVPTYGSQAVATADRDGIHLGHRAVITTTAESYRILAHERLHTVSAPWGQGSDWTSRLVCHEEAAADAVSVDLTRARYPRGIFASSYPVATRWIRLVSMRATGAAWQSPTAVAWRITFMRSSVAQRAELVAGDPEACPTAEFEQVTP